MTQIKCFDKINENGQSKLGSSSDLPFGSGRGFGLRPFYKNKKKTKKTKQMKSKQKELNEHPRSGLDPPIWSDRKGVLQMSTPLLPHLFWCIFLHSLYYAIFPDHTQTINFPPYLRSLFTFYLLSRFME